MKYKRILSLSSVFVLFLGLALGAPQGLAQGPGFPPGLNLPLPFGQLPEPGFAKGKTVFVATIGADLPQCGRQATPCRTINHGLKRARQIQDDPVAADEPTAFEFGFVDTSGRTENLVTVQVGPGTYDEKVVITGNWIRLLGAGPGSSILTVGTGPGFFEGTALLVTGGHPVWIEGFTLSDNSFGLLVQTQGVVTITNCEFRDKSIGLWAEFSTVLFRPILDRPPSTFSNNGHGLIVLQGNFQLFDVTITGQGTGIGAGVIVVAGRVGFHPGTQISNAGVGYRVQAGSSGVAFVGTQISGNGVGVHVDEGSTLTLFNPTVIDNVNEGIIVTDGSFLRTFGGVVSGNGGLGIFFDAFSHGVLRGGTLIVGNAAPQTDTDATSAFLVRP